MVSRYWKRKILKRISAQEPVEISFLYTERTFQFFQTLQRHKTKRIIEIFYQPIFTPSGKLAQNILFHPILSSGNLFACIYSRWIHVLSFNSLFLNQISSLFFLFWIDRYYLGNKSPSDVWKWAFYRGSDTCVIANYNEQINLLFPISLISTSLISSIIIFHTTNLRN